jgi:SulP family sulfate permease
MKIKNFVNNFKLNIKSGLTVSLVSIPLSVSLAVASQTTPVVGIITAIWAGLIASLFGGSKYNVVGPTGALSGLLAAFAIANGADALPTLAIVSGVLILFAYLLKLEKYLIFIPKSAIVGFTLGVAVIIGLGQLNSAFGIKVPAVHEKFIENLIESFHNFNTLSLETIIVFVVCLADLFIFTKKFPKIPGAVLLTPFGILLGYLSVSNIIPIKILTLGDKFPTMSPQIFASWSLKFSPEIIIPAITIAVIAILETMLSAKVADNMTKTKHNKRKEMFGLGLANIGSGLMGGIPATAALARTSLNIKTDATSNLSATISSISILLISFLLLTTFKFIPMSVIAAILVFVAIRMVEIAEFKHMFKNDKSAFFLSLVVAIITVVEDPIIGIMVGTAISLIVFVNKLSEGQFELAVNNKEHVLHSNISREDEIALLNDVHTLVYTIKGQLVYINAQAHVNRFEHKLFGTENIIIRLRELYFIDLDGVEALDEILEICKVKKINVYISGVNKFIDKMCNNSNDYRRLADEGKILPKTKDVLKILGFDLQGYKSLKD